MERGQRDTGAKEERMKKERKTGMSLEDEVANGTERGGNR